MISDPYIRKYKHEQTGEDPWFQIFPDIAFLLISLCSYPIGQPEFGYTCIIHGTLVLCMQEIKQRSTL
ncbi:hypothetical protein RchiOBHm_Chr3g0465951 [Rosa chinensis]|uniref:Uncharacterized protein n=1 Tax=Rosa chinensis TaxID=74649 RepID=A0A2P6R9V5_ROSCH|nr:hypothetical protein RchiOBHm_Chr3g0465951 [Rosa chinensis]